MKITIDLNKKDLHILTLAWYGCGCESYYRHQCSMCKEIANGLLETHEKSIERLKILNIIKTGGYSYLELTDKGKDIWWDLQR